jgi:hypothetical protein
MESPRSLRLVVVAGKVQSRAFYIGSGVRNNNYTMSSKFTGEDCNERLMQALSKRYSSNLSLFKTECPQFSNVGDGIFEKYKIKGCNELLMGYDAPTGSGSKITEGGIVGGNWDANKAANWLKEATAGLDSQSICCYAVQCAVLAGGIHIDTNVGSGYKQAKYMFEVNKHWDLIDSGIANSKEINFKVPLQVGDIVGMTEGPSTSAYGHIAMYCGTEDRWISDYHQKNPYVYTSKGQGRYWLIRYKGGEKSGKLGPGPHCLSGKCLKK